MVLCVVSPTKILFGQKKISSSDSEALRRPTPSWSMTLHSFTQAGFLWKKYIKFFRFHICIVLCIFYLIVSLIPVHSFNRLKKKKN